MADRASPQVNTLVPAAELSYHGALRILVEGDGDPDELLTIYPTFDANSVPEQTGGLSFLHYACRHNHLVCLKGLLRCPGVDLKAHYGVSGCTPLFWAVRG